MPCHWGNARLNVVTESSATGSQCLPAVGCAEAARYISRRQLPGCVAYGDELTYVSLGEGATSEGEFWESLNSACTLHLPVLYVVADNGYAISVPSSDQAPAPVSELVRGFRGLHVHVLDGCDYFEVRERAQDIVAEVRAGRRSGDHPRPVTRPYSHSSADTQSKYRSAGELAAGVGPRPARADGAGSASTVACTAPNESSEIKEEARQIVVEAARAALAAPRPDPASVTRPRGQPAQRPARGASSRMTAPARWSPSEKPSGAPSTSRWRRTSASGCSARTWPTPGRRCWPT